MKKLLSIIFAALVLCAGNLCAESKVELIKKTDKAEIYLRDGIKFFNREAIGGGNKRINHALFCENEDNKSYAIYGLPDFEPLFVTMSLDLDKREAAVASVPFAEQDAALYKIYSQMNVDEILEKLKEFPKTDFVAVYEMLYLISERVATIEDKRKIIDFFMERFELSFPPRERGEAKAAFEKVWKELCEEKSTLKTCFCRYSFEYAGHLIAILHYGAQKDVIVDMLQNSTHVNPEISKMLWASVSTSEVDLCYKIYRNSLVGKEQNLKDRQPSFQLLERLFGEKHPLIRTAKIQEAMLAGEFCPEFASEMREIVDKNYEIAFPLAIETARKNKDWDDLAYYAYRCLKRDVYGIQKQFKEDRSSYFDYLEFLLEGLAKSDPQAAGTLFEFVAALPQTDRQDQWLVRAKEVMNGVEYDKNSATNAGKSMAEKGFYQNQKFEERFLKTFQNSKL